MGCCSRSALAAGGKLRSAEMSSSPCLLRPAASPASWAAGDACRGSDHLGRGKGVTVAVG